MGNIVYVLGRFRIIVAKSGQKKSDRLCSSFLRKKVVSYCVWYHIQLYIGLLTLPAPMTKVWSVHCCIYMETAFELNSVEHVIMHVLIFQSHPDLVGLFNKQNNGIGTYLWYEGCHDRDAHEHMFATVTLDLTNFVKRLER